MKNHKFLVQVISIITLLFIVLFLYRIAQMPGLNVQDLENNSIKVYETVELKSQADFRLLGDIIYKARGFEPGFTLNLSLAGTKFGADLTSKYGESKYVGYIDLISQGTSSKFFAGKVLDKDNNIQSLEINILDEKCFEASGDEQELSVEILVGENLEDLQGCAELVK